MALPVTPQSSKTPPRDLDSIRFFVPSNFDAAASLPPDLARYADGANYLVHRAVTGTAFWQADQDGFVPLKVEYLRKVTPDRHERRVRQALLAAGVLECDGRFERGVKCLGYRLGPAYRAAAVRAVACRDPRVARRVARLREGDFRTAVRLDIHRHLRGWLDRVTIDADQARQIVLDSPRLATNADLHLHAVDLFAAGDRQFSFCAQGRVHTNVTWMPREVRAALRVCGEALVGIDVRNAQPLLVALLVLQYRRAGDRLLNVRSLQSPPANPYRTLLPVPRTPSGPTPPSITMSNPAQVDAPPELGRDLSVLTDDEQRYLDLCECGSIYEHMLERLAAGGVLLGREQVKVEFCRLYYGRDLPQHALKDNLTRAFAAAFRAEFPGVAAVVGAVKRRAGDYRALAWLMQRYESTVIVNTACRRLMNEHPHVPVVTIHDSVLTTPAHADLVAGVMRDEFERVGLRPRFNRDDRPAVDGRDARLASDGGPSGCLPVRADAA